MVQGATRSVTWRSSDSHFAAVLPSIVDGLGRQRLGEPAKPTKPPLSFVFNRSGTGFCRLSMTSPPWPLIERRLSGIESNERELRLTAIPKGGASALAAVSALIARHNWDVPELHLESGRLDEVFRTLTQPAGLDQVPSEGEAA